MRRSQVFRFFQNEAILEIPISKMMCTFCLDLRAPVFYQNVGIFPIDVESQGTLQFVKILDLIEGRLKEELRERKGKWKQ